MIPLDRIRYLSIIAHIDHGKSTLADRILELSRRGRPARHAGPVPRLDGPRARAGHHDQGPERPARRGRTTSSTSSTPPATSTSATRSRAASPRARARCCSSTRARASRRRRWPTATCARARPRDRRRAQQDRPPRGRARPASPRRSSGCSASRPTRSCASRPRPAKACPSCSTRSSSRSPPPTGDPDAPLQALIFDSYYDPYRGVVSAVRVFDGTLVSGARLRVPAGERRRTTPRRSACGRRRRRRSRRSGPARSATSSRGSRTSARRASARRSRPRRVRPRRSPATATRSRWCSAACIRSTATSTPICARRSSELRLNDSSFTYEPETSGALGFGFRCGFLGLLHMEIVRERLEREYDLSLVATAPNVEYRRPARRRRRRGRRQPVGDAAAEPDRRRSRSRTSRSRCSRPPSTSAR